MRAAGVTRIVFSSSAAVYGTPDSTPIPEDHPTRPINPYGETKRAFEAALDWYARAYDMAAVSLRYFNVAGATQERGEDHHPETHLIPNMLHAALGGEPLKVFGTDYDTPDGTCIRDYIHVSDLADAHIGALEMTAEVSATHIACNLGSGSGFSVLEMLRAAKSAVGREIPHTFAPRREGDPAVLVASNVKAAELLGWQPRRGTLSEMIGSAWRWHQAHPKGYAAEMNTEIELSSPRERRDWRPQVVKSGRHVPEVTDPILEPLWTGTRVLAHFRDSEDVEEWGQVQVIDEFGDDASLDAPQAVDQLRRSIQAREAVIDGVITKEATAGGENTAIGLFPTVNPIRKFFLGGTARMDVKYEPRGPRREGMSSFVAIDLLSVDDQPLLDAPLLERKRILEAIIEPHELVRISPWARPPVRSGSTHGAVPASGG